MQLFWGDGGERVYTWFVICSIEGKDPGARYEARKKVDGTTVVCPCRFWERLSCGAEV